jgi:probable phosphoglycerate mutase
MPAEGDVASAPATDATQARHAVPRPPGAVAHPDTAEPLTIVLLRHGVTPLTLSGAYSGGGVPGPSLTGHGRMQAARAADLVHRVGRELWQDLPQPQKIVASPMVRTQETAAAVAHRLGRDIETDPAFAECDFGEWEGLTAEEIEDRWSGATRLWHETGTFQPPGGESIAQVGERVWGGVRALVDSGVDRTVVVVSHSVSVRALVGTAIGAPASHWSRIRVAPASLSIVRVWPDDTAEVSVVGIPCET